MRLLAISAGSSLLWWLLLRTGPSVGVPKADSFEAGNAIAEGALATRRLQSMNKLASGSLTYVPPISAPVGCWYQELTVHSSSSDTFFAMSRFQFGYAGVQNFYDGSTTTFTGIIIFSIWDRGCNALDDDNACPLEDRAVVEETGHGVQVARFGNEGTGYQAKIISPGLTRGTRAGKTYAIMIKSEPAGSHSGKYSAYFWDEDQSWRLIARIRVGIGSSPWALTDLGSFVEHFTARDPQDQRWGQLGPSFVSTGLPHFWAPITEARFSTVPMPNENPDYTKAIVVPNGEQWGLGIGGSSMGRTLDGTRLVVRPGGPEKAIALQLFEELHDSGNLPTGCLGSICPGAMVRGAGAAVVNAVRGAAMGRAAMRVLIALVLIVVLVIATRSSQADPTRGLQLIGVE